MIRTIDTGEFLIDFNIDGIQLSSCTTKIPKIKEVIYSGDKTIVLWKDNTKTIVSCHEEDDYDEYAGFCAAVTKKVFGSTSQAKKTLEKKKRQNQTKIGFLTLKEAANNIANTLSRCFGGNQNEKI